ncbi:16S rRNA (cytosine(1402)-N(4))-methyltransferase RsmH [Candidatus Dojkabacteria bacterium]|nr:16S rRNA (cytosine(1402)-N(4))-methyltransferase RsmH [Candidatus Dojkabacteria bacterium]
MEKTKHISVLPKEVLEYLKPEAGEVIVDATLGGGGHFEAMIIEVLKQNSSQKTAFVGIDKDEKAIERYRENSELLKQLEDDDLIEIHLIHSSFSELEGVLENLQFKKVDKILADLGTSQDQLEDQERGFSIKGDAKLDMRMDANSRVTAADLLNGLTEKELVKLFNELADLRGFSRRFVRKIIQYRKKQPILTTKELKKLIYQALSAQNRRGSRTSSLEARVFQALRIAVNQELYSLTRFLPQAFEALSFEGRLGVISFHSGEDRIVKNFFRERKKVGEATVIDKLIEPSESEIAANSRSSSAKMRVLRKHSS